MSPSHPTTGFGVGAPRSALGATLRRRWRALLAVGGSLTLLAFALDWALGVDALTVVRATGVAPEWRSLISMPLTEQVLRWERASLVGLCGLAVAAPLLATRDREDVRLRDGDFGVALAIVGGVLGVAVGSLLGVDVVVAVLGSGFVEATGAGGRFWLAELSVSIVATCFVAGALPGGVVAAVRSGLVGSSPTSRQRWLTVLALLAFVAVYSPADSVTFVLGAAVVLAGFVAGLAAVEYDVV